MLFAGRAHRARHRVPSIASSHAASSDPGRRSTGSCYIAVRHAVKIRPTPSARAGAVARIDDATCFQNASRPRRCAPKTPARRPPRRRCPRASGAPSWATPRSSSSSFVAMRAALGRTSARKPRRSISSASSPRRVDLVRLGVPEVRARPRRPRTAAMSDDFPTFEQPAIATSVSLAAGQRRFSSGRGAAEDSGKDARQGKRDIVSAVRGEAS